MKLFFVLFFLLILAAVFSSDFKFPQKKFAKCLKKCKAHVGEKEVKNKVKFCVKYCLPKVDKILKKPIEEKKPIDVKPMSDSNDGEILDNRILWSRYRTALFDFFRMGDKNAMPNLMLLTTPYPAEWDENPSQLDRFLNTEPKQSSTYEPTIINIAEEYGVFLRSIQSKPLKKYPELEKLGDDVGNAQEELYEEYNKCRDKYDLIKGYKDPYEDYEYRVCWRIRQKQLDYEQALFAYEQKRYLLIGDTVLFDAYNNYFNAKGVFSWEAAGSIKNFKEAAKEGRTNSFEVKITSMTKTSTQSSYTSEIGFGIKAAISGFSLGIDGKMSKSEMRLHTHDSQFQLIFGAKGYKAIPVYPGKWFSAKALYQYKNGPFIKQPTTPFFGKDGKISLIPKMLYVVVGPKIDMYVSETDKQELERTKNFSISGNFGYMEVIGLNFNYNKGSTFKSSKETDKLYKITIEGNSYEPQILMVDYDFIQ